MPSVRFSRDKRGYEYVYLMHTSTRRGKPGRSQVLYWYRTPPGVRIGRKPFSEEVQRMLEAQNPGVSFDWPAIISTPMPPPDMTEFWRERRRAAKAAKQQSRAQETEESADAESDDASDAIEPVVDDAVTEDLQVEGFEATADAAPDETAKDAVADDGASRKRRRRRGGRRRKSGSEQPLQAAANSQTEGDQMSLAPSPHIDSDVPSEPAE